MTEEELMDMARPFAADGGRWPSDWLAAMNAAILAEREACARLCEERHDLKIATTYDWTKQVGQDIAAAIRARSNGTKLSGTPAARGCAMATRFGVAIARARGAQP